MSSRRAILLEALDAWHGEGALDEATWTRLRARYAAPVDGEEEDAEDTAKRSFAPDAMQFVGGLLVGAALVALVIFMEIDGPAFRWALLALGALLLGPATAAALRGMRPGFVEAGLAAGLVPLAVAAGAALGEDDALVPGIVLLAAAGVTALRRAAGASTVVAMVAFVFAAGAATVFPELFSDPPMAARWLWLALLAGYLALLLTWRQRVWSNVGQALMVGPLVVAFLLIIEPFGTGNSVAMELAVGLYLVVLLALALTLRSRGLVAGAAAGLTIDAIVFAFDVGGPGTAVVVLLALGGLLLWQAELVRRFFRREA